MVAAGNEEQVNAEQTRATRGSIRYDRCAGVAIRILAPMWQIALTEK
jgi:hypothetical protein